MHNFGLFNKNIFLVANYKQNCVETLFIPILFTGKKCFNRVSLGGEGGVMHSGPPPPGCLPDTESILF